MNVLQVGEVLASFSYLGPVRERPKQVNELRGNWHYFPLLG